MSVAERFREIAHDKKLKNKEFDKSIGKSVGYLSTLLKQGSYPSVEVLIKVMEQYDQYNIDWILTGKGDKIKKEGMVSEDAAAYGKAITIDRSVLKSLDTKAEEIKKMIAKILNEDND